MKNAKKFNSVVLLALLITVICALNIMVLFRSRAEAIPPPYNWVPYGQGVEHCESSDTYHCTPESAYSW